MTKRSEEVFDYRVMIGDERFYPIASTPILFERPDL
jgi:hypothetical protein